MTDGIVPANFKRELAELRKEVKDLQELIRRRGGALWLDQLRDVEAPYDHWTDLPKLDQALRWVTGIDNRFHGVARFLDPTPVAGYYEQEITGSGLPEGIEEYLVDEAWELERPCLVTATASIDDTWEPVEVDPPTDPPTYIEGPQFGLQLTDGGTGRVVMPVAGYESAIAVRSLQSPYTASQSVAWLFLRGRPKVSCRTDISAEQATGMTALPTTLRILTRVVRL